MRMLRILFLVPLAYLMSSGAGAEWSGNRLLEHCSTPIGQSGQSHCIGYVQGVIDHDFELARARYFAYILTYRLYEAGKIRTEPKPYQRRFCMPKSVSLDKALDIFKTWLRAHPERRHKPANLLVIESFKSAWPCS